MLSVWEKSEEKKKRGDVEWLQSKSAPQHLAGKMRPRSGQERSPLETPGGTETGKYSCRGDCFVRLSEGQEIRFKNGHSCSETLINGSNARDKK